MRRAAIAAAAGGLLVAAAVAGVLFQRDTRLAGTNSLVATSKIALPVEPGRRRCAPDQTVPRDTSALMVYAGTYHRPRGVPFQVTIRHRGRQVRSVRAAGGWPDNSRIRLSIPRIPRDLVGAEVCFSNLGRGRLGLGGNRTPPHGPVVGGREVPRVDWLLAGEPSWWDIAPRITRRAAVFKPGFVGPWTFPALLLALGALWAGSLALLLRREDT